VGTFTPLLGSLLLNQNVLVGEVARNCVVELLKRIVTNDTRNGALGEQEREMLERELIEGVIIALARLGEGPTEDEMQGQEAGLHEQGSVAAGKSSASASSTPSSPSFEPPTPLPASEDSVLQLEPLPNQPQAPDKASPDIPPALPIPSVSSPAAAAPSSGQEQSFILSPTQPTITASPDPLPNVPAETALTSPHNSVHSESTDPSTPSLSSTVNSASSSSELEFSGSDSLPPPFFPHPLTRQSGRIGIDAGDDDVDATTRSPDPLNPATVPPRFSAALQGDEFKLQLPIPVPQSADPNVSSTEGGGLHDQPAPSMSLPASSPSLSLSLSSPSTEAGVTQPAAATRASLAQSEPDTGPGLKMEIEMEPVSPMVQRSSAPAFSDDGGDVTPRVEKGDMLSYEILATSPEPAPARTRAGQALPHASDLLSQHHDPVTSLPEISPSDAPTSLRPRSASTSVITETSSLSRTTEPQIRGADESLATPVECSCESDSMQIISPIAESSAHNTTTVTTAPTPVNAEVVSDEAAVGCVASMSLMAAVAASGYLPEYAKGMFVAEVARVGTDPVYWVRREAAYVLGALTKVVDDEMLLEYLVGSWNGDHSFVIDHKLIILVLIFLGKLRFPCTKVLLVIPLGRFDSLLFLLSHRSLSDCHPKNGVTLRLQISRS
jgi:hypothetical protein